MRIGKVSEKYHISVDNIYYYINYGLLVPPKPRGQYVFDEQTVRDLEWILSLKELDFSLREIHVILSLKRISGLADPQDMEELKEIFKGKRDFCQKEIGRKQQILEQLDSHIKSVKASPSTVPVSLSRLCPFCAALSAEVPSPCLKWKWTSALSTKGTYPVPAVTAPTFPQASS